MLNSMGKKMLCNPRGGSVLIQLLLVLLVFNGTDLVLAHKCSKRGFFIASETDKALSLTAVGALEIVENVTSLLCLLRCTQNNQCQSLNFKESATSICEVLAFSKGTTGAVFKKRIGWSHFEHSEESGPKCPQEVCGPGYQCFENCTNLAGYECKDVCTLATSKCHKNATCSNNLGNITCTCRPGYIGNGTSCKEIGSCLDWFETGARENGNYTIVGGNGMSFRVFCDLTSEGNSTWTLAASFALKNNNEFKQSPFYFDKPLNEEMVQWKMYRLSKSKMEMISFLSTHWRMTCSFSEYGIDYRDYIRAKTSQINPLTFKGSWTHATVEYVNIRGNQRSNLSIPFWQQDWRTFFVSSFYTPELNKDSVTYEDNFGFYGSPNNKFRCTHGEESTTQLWYGELH